MVIPIPFMGSKPKTGEYPAFTNFTIKVDVEDGYSWTTTVKKVLKSVGVTNFRMENNGKVNISGYIDPNLLLKCLQKAGKTAQIVHWQYGECSSNLYEKPSVNYGNMGHYLYDGYNNGYGDCSGHHIQSPRTRSKSEFQKLSSHPPSCCSLM